MIKIKRPEQIPEALNSPTAIEARETLRQDAEDPFIPRLDELEPRLQPELDRAFHHKCAFCEGPFKPDSPSELDRLMHDEEEPIQETGWRSDSYAQRLRPKTGAAEFDMSRAPEHYHWLAFDWQNLYASCDECARFRSVKERNPQSKHEHVDDAYFPVEGARAAPGTSVAEARRTENALLLDPCYDDPAGHLMFTENGDVVGRLVSEPGERERYGMANRGQITIDAFGLNRPDLGDRRQRAARGFRELWEALRESLEARTGKKIESRARAVLDATGVATAFASMKRDLLGQWLGRWLRPADAGGEPGERRLELLGESPPGAELVALWRRFDRLTKPSPVGLIESVYIENFRSIGELKLDFPAETGKEGARQAPWKVLLGENGVGKSSVLKAVGLALIGEQRARWLLKRMRTSPATLLRKLPAGEGGGRVEQAVVRVQLTGARRLEYRIEADEIHFTAGGEGVTEAVVRGYGATRLLPQSNLSEIVERVSGADPTRPRQRVDNLFDVHQALANAEAWIARSWPSSEAPLCEALTTLLDLGDGGLGLTEEGEIWVAQEDKKIPIEELSAGNQTILALAADILTGIPDRLDDLASARGIVLLDEIGSHLHPRWRQRIVPSLRRVFPGIQFVATTHEPLCLIGLREREVAVLKQGEGARLEVLDDGLPSPEGLRADQLLTSPLFGLETTIDPALDDKFREYYDLLARNAEEERERREELEAKLAGYGVLGYTRRDQMLYRVIDEVLARDSGALYGELDEDIKKRLSELWPRAKAGQTT
ncbi:MAG: AAA family ATPase [bacterium]|nr:AAA family ATPase [bacterium]